MKMKITIQIALLLFSIFLGHTSLLGQTLSDKVSFRAATYNIRYRAASDETTGNGWDQRKQALAQVILEHGFEIFGTQEGDTVQMAQLKTLLPGYDYIAQPYGGKGDLHTCSILYKKDRFELVQHSVFWLSETPDVPSIGWDATDRRICQWAKIRDKNTGRLFYFFNAHFYWRYHRAKQASGPVLVSKIKDIAGDAHVLCVGDFNSTAETSQIKAIKVSLQDAFEASENGTKGFEDTNLGGGNFEGTPEGRIDYIFVSKDIQVKNYEVYADQYGSSRYPSDHLPVSCDVTF